MAALPKELAESVIRCLLHDPAFLREVYRSVDPNDFVVIREDELGECTEDRTYVRLVECLIDTYQELGVPPSPASLRGMLLDDGVVLNGVQLSEPDPDPAVIRSRYLRWVREQSIRDCISDIRQLIDTKPRQSHYMREVQEILGEALKTGTPRHLEPVNYFEDPIARMRETFAEHGDAVSTGLEELDAVLGGGLHKGELGVVVALPGYGKTSTLITFGAAGLRRGLKVGHVTLEIAKHTVCLRYDCSILGLDTGALRNAIAQGKEAEIAEGLQEWRGQDGDLRVYQYPPSVASVVDLRVVLEPYRPDLVIVDYADLLRPSRERTGQFWLELGEIYEHLRAMAVEFDIPVWTASQAVRTSLRNKKKDTPIHLDEVAGAFAKAFVADTIVSLNVDENTSHAEIYVAKTRQSARGGKVPVLLDWARCRVTGNDTNETATEDDGD